MPGLMPGIHVFGKIGTQNVDGQDKPGHDEKVREVLGSAAG